MIWEDWGFELCGWTLSHWSSSGSSVISWDASPGCVNYDKTIYDKITKKGKILYYICIHNERCSTERNSLEKDSTEDTECLNITIFHCSFLVLLCICTRKCFLKGLWPDQNTKCPRICCCPLTVWQLVDGLNISPEVSQNFSAKTENREYYLCNLQVTAARVNKKWGVETQGEENLDHREVNERR